MQLIPNWPHDCVPSEMSPLDVVDLTSSTSGEDDDDDDETVLADESSCGETADDGHSEDDGPERRCVARFIVDDDSSDDSTSDVPWMDVSHEVEVETDPSGNKKAKESNDVDSIVDASIVESMDVAEPEGNRDRSRSSLRPGRLLLNPRPQCRDATLPKTPEGDESACAMPFRLVRPRPAFLRANEALKNWNRRYAVLNGIHDVRLYSLPRRVAAEATSSSSSDSDEESENGADSSTSGASSESPDSGNGEDEGSRNCRDSQMLKMTSSYVLNRICEDVQQEMAGKSTECEIDWTVNAEVLFFYALIGHKPVGVNRHFMMLLIHNKFSAFLNREISSKALWDHLDTMYDMSALHESEIIPFPNDEVDFELPEDCHDLLHSKHGVKLERSNSENDINKNSASSSKSSRKPTPKLKQSSTPASNPKNNFASPVLNKPSKSQSAVKSEVKSSDATPKTKPEPGLSSKTSKVKRSSSPFSNKTVKAESSSITKEDSPDISSNKKNSKLERGSSPAVLKKPIKVEATVTNSTSKKPSKSESSSNGSKPAKSETPDGSVKKIKPDKDVASKKGKTVSLSSEVSTKKPKAEVNSVKKKNEHETSSKKSSSESSVKQVKAEVKSSSHSSKGQETGTPPPSGSRKSSPVVKIKVNESGKKLKRPRVEENSKKSTPAPKRRRL